MSDAASDPQGAAIVRAIIAMGASLGLRTLVEGVETVEQLAFLREAGCDEIQGYWLGRPRAAGDLDADLERIPARLSAAAATSLDARHRRAS